jgi:PAS domain S-box-containing protein
MSAELLNPANYRTSLFALPTLLTASTMLALGLMVVIREHYSRVSIAFFIMTAAAAIWLSGYSLMYCASTAPVAAAWSVIGHIGIVFIPASVYHFTVASLQLYNRYKRRVWLVWEVSAVFLITTFSGEAFLAGIRPYWWGYYPIYNWMGALFVCFFFGLMALSLHHYWTAVRSAVPGTGKLRNRGLLAAFTIAYIGSVDYLPAFGVPLYPFGYAPVLGFIILVDRTIRRYRLVDITPELAAREIINAMDDALLLLDNDGFVRGANRSACRMFGRTETELEGTPCSTLVRVFDHGDELARQILNGSLREQECLTDGGAGVVTFSSFVMRDAGKFATATVCIIRDITKDRAAQQQIKRHTERQAALYELNIAATSTLELRAVLGVLLERLAGLVPQTATTVMLLDTVTHQLRRVACRGIDEITWQSEPSAASESTHPVLQSKDAISISDIQLADTGLDGAFFVRQGFQSYLGLPLIAKNQVVGILSFYAQEKRHFSDEEITFLRSLAGHAAAAIYNSQLYEQTSQQAIALERANRVREDFLSVMSHELRTPLNVITGYAKLVQEGVMGEINADWPAADSWKSAWKFRRTIRIRTSEAWRGELSFLISRVGTESGRRSRGKTKSWPQASNRKTASKPRMSFTYAPPTFTAGPWCTWRRAIRACCRLSKSSKTILIKRGVRLLHHSNAWKFPTKATNCPPSSGPRAANQPRSYPSSITMAAPMEFYYAAKTVAPANTCVVACRLSTSMARGMGGLCVITNFTLRLTQSVSPRPLSIIS